MKDIDGSIEEKLNGLGGSRQVNEYKVIVNGKVIKVKIETYVGISIFGDDDIVFEIGKKVKSEI